MAMIKNDADIGSIKGKLAAALDDSPGLLVATGATLLYGMNIANGVAAMTYIQCFDAAELADVTLGTTTPDLAIPVITSGTLELTLTKPILFPKGLVVFSTNSATGATGAATNGTIYYA